MHSSLNDNTLREQERSGKKESNAARDTNQRTAARIAFQHDFEPIDVGSEEYRRAHADIASNWRGDGDGSEKSLEQRQNERETKMNQLNKLRDERRELEKKMNALSAEIHIMDRLLAEGERKEEGEEREKERGIAFCTEAMNNLQELVARIKRGETVQNNPTDVEVNQQHPT